MRLKSLSTIPDPYDAPPGLRTCFWAPTSTPTLFPPYHRKFNFCYVFLRAFNYYQWFSSPSTHPHTSTASPSQFQDLTPIFEPGHSFLISYPHFELFPFFFNQFHVFSSVPNFFQPSTSSWTHPEPSTCVFKTNRTFFYPFSSIFEYFQYFLNIFLPFSILYNLFQSLLHTFTIINCSKHPPPLFSTSPYISAIFTYCTTFFWPFSLF